MSRLLATLRWDATLQVRYKLYAVSVFVVLFLGGALQFLPAAVRVEALVPAFLVGNLMVTTFYFVCALVLLEKADGVLTALVVTPLREAEYLLSKMLTLTALALAENVLVIALLFEIERWGFLLAGAALLSAFYVFAGFIFVARYNSINEMLMPSVLVITACMLPLLPHFGLTSRLPFLLHPVEPMMVLLRASYTPASGGLIAYGFAGSLVWVAVSFVWARQRFERFIVQASGV